MTDGPHQDKPTAGLDERLSTLEGILKLDERLKSIETTLISKGVAANVAPWWRSRGTVITLGALIAAVVPLVTAVNAAFKNWGDSARLIIEQQDKIRQTYLDRVLKPGITEGEQQRIFALLSRLKGDPELQEWAKEEFDKATQKIEELRKEKAHLEEQNKSLENQLAAARGKNVQPASQRPSGSSIAVQRLGKEVTQTHQKVANLQRRIGEPSSGPDGSQTVTCTSPDGSATVTITCRGGAMCYAPAGGDPVARCLDTAAADQ